jgi:hypothetical protein
MDFFTQFSANFRFLRTKKGNPAQKLNRPDGRHKTSALHSGFFRLYPSVMQEMAIF